MLYINGNINRQVNNKERISIFCKMLHNGFKMGKVTQRLFLRASFFACAVCLHMCKQNQKPGLVITYLQTYQE